MVHVALEVLHAERVEHLVHARHAEGGEVQHLRVTTLEQPGAMRGRDQVHLGRERPDVGRAAAVDADALLDDPLAHDLLRERADCRFDLTLALGELRRQLGDERGRRLVESRVALGLARDGVRLRDQVGSDCADPLEDVVAVVDEKLEWDRLFLADLRDELELELDRLADPRLGCLQTLGDDFLGDLRGTGLVELPSLLGATGLDHHDGDVGIRVLGKGTAGDDELECRLVALLVRAVGDPRAVLAVSDTDGADGTLERDARQHESRRGAVDGDHVVRVLLVGAEDRADDVHFVPEAFRERRAERAVDQAVSQDGLVARATLPAEERAGDLPSRVHPLLDVDGEGEEIRPLSHLPGGGGRDEHDRVADSDKYSPIRLAGKLAGLEGQGLVGPTYRSRHSDGVSHDTPHW